MTPFVFADAFRPAARKNALVYDVALVLGGSLFLALSAQIAFQMHLGARIGLVPLTAQTMAVLLVGALLGAHRGALCVAVYLAEGAAGLPVFANLNGGAAYMAGPTGGYLAGFVVAAFLTGFLAERGWDRKPIPTLAMLLLGNAVIFAFGLAWLSGFLGFRLALVEGLYRFIPGDLLKIVLAAGLLPAGWKLMRRA